jgi:uncharacterized membrane protein YkvA (DUF1232 family)
MAPEAWKRWARERKRDSYALFLAARDPRVPWYTKALALCVVGYALSPIDLIPDFIPIVGYLDDLILVPLGLALVLRLTPSPALDEARRRAQEAMDRGALSRSLPARIATLIVVVVWLAAVALAGLLFVRAFIR